MRPPIVRAAAGLLLALVVVVCPLLPAAGQSTTMQATITVSTANVRSGPGTNFSLIGQARQGATFNLVGRNAADNWWVICCINNRQGWISNTVARVNGNTATLPIANTIGSVTPVPPPPPTPAPQSFPDWKGEYFNDINLQPPPLMVRNDPRLDFAWNLDSPDPRVPADNFSVRWTRSVNFPAGNLVFFARTSDGVRVWVDNILVINEWRDTEGYPTYTGKLFELSAGWHTVRVEYYERGGIAYATVWWEPLRGPQ
jgi:uncharacterized protein YraI